VLAVVLQLLQGPPEPWLRPGTVVHVGRLALLLAGGGVAYFGTLALLGFRLRDFSRRAA